jgi:hypothetical protein
MFAGLAVVAIGVERQPRFSGATTRGQPYEARLAKLAQYLTWDQIG